MDDGTLLFWLGRGKILAGALVAVGVAGEFLADFIESPIIKRRDDAQRAQIAQLGKDTGDANARAAEANRIAEQERLARVELEARLAPRTLSLEQQVRIRSELTKLAGQYVTITFINDSFEAAAFASQIRDVLSGAKWVITLFAPMTPGGNGLPTSIRGVGLMTEPPVGSKVAAAALLSALTKEGVLAFVSPLRTKNEEALYLSAPDDPMNNRVLVVVGSHP
jgi:hypothetical protein